MHRITTTLMLLAAVLLAPLATMAQEYDHEEIIEDRFDIGNGDLLTIDSDLGSIEIVGGNGDNVFLTVIKGVNNVSDREADRLFDRFELDIRESSRGLEILGDYDKPSGKINWKRSLRVHFQLTVPSDTEIDVKTAGGSISIEDIDAEVMAKTSGGSLTLEDIDGPLNAHTSGGSIKAFNIGDRTEVRTSGGSITIENADGYVSAKTSGGSIKVNGADGDVDANTSGGSITLKEVYGSVNAQTSGGSVTAEVIGQPQEDMTLKTSGGTVTLYIEDDVRADINASASGGSVSTEIPVSIIGQKKRSKLEGEMNGGGPLFTLRSSGGSVRIKDL